MTSNLPRKQCPKVTRQLLRIPRTTGLEPRKWTNAFCPRDPTLTQMLLDHRVVCQRDDLVVDHGLSAFQDELPDRLEIWEPPGHVWVHGTKHPDGGRCHFDKDATEHLPQTESRDGLLHLPTHPLDPLDAHNKGQGMVIWSFQAMRLHLQPSEAHLVTLLPPGIMQEPLEAFKRELFSFVPLPLLQERLLRLGGFQGLVRLPLFQEILRDQGDLFPFPDDENRDRVSMVWNGKSGRLF